MADKVFICGPRDKIKPSNFWTVVNVTSQAPDDLGKSFSPFTLGPLYLDNGLRVENMENLWQYSKVYPKHVDTLDQPTQDFFEWAGNGYRRNYADRYPMGKGAIPLYSYWNGEHLDYIEARKKIYIPQYAWAIRKYRQKEFYELKSMYYLSGGLALFDFDGYNHRELGMSWDEVINNPRRKMGHAFVLGMMLEGYIS